MVRSVDLLIDLQRPLRVTERPLQVPFGLKNLTDVVGAFPPNVPRSIIWPSFQKTALPSGPPLSGSISLFPENPATSPFAVIQLP